MNTQKSEIHTRTSDLIELAILASKYKLENESIAIREAIEAIADNSCLPQAVSGLCAMHSGDYSLAITILSDPSLNDFPDVATAKRYLALAYKMVGELEMMEKVQSELNQLTNFEDDTFFSELDKN